MFLPNAGLGSWPDDQGSPWQRPRGSVRSRDDSWCGGFAPRTLAQGSTALSAPRARGLHAFPELERKPAGAGAGLDLRPPVQEVTGESTAGKRSRGPPPGHVLRRSGRGGGASKPRADRDNVRARGLLRGCLSRGAGAEGLPGEDGVWGRLTMATTGGDLQMAPEQLMARKRLR